MKRNITVNDNGIITFWNIYKQQWEKKLAHLISDEVYSSLSDFERKVINDNKEKSVETYKQQLIDYGMTEE
jgi:hypothetical protein